MTQNGSPNSHATTADVGEQRVARVYAEAILNAAAKRGLAEQTLEELDSLARDVFRAAPQFELFLASGAISRERKAALIRSAFEGRASEVFVDALQVLNDHDRLALLRPIVGAYKELYDRRAGRVQVRVSTAVALPDDQRERLRQELSGILQWEPVIETDVDPELLGGLVLRVGDWLYDASVRTQLETIRNQIIARSSHEIQSRRDRFRAADGD
jgi:F-type H+-transporting ATPase subunit delta